MKVLTITGLTSLLFLNMACSKSQNVERDLNPNSYTFKVLSQTTAKADGFSDLTVNMQVMDFYGKPLAGHVTQFNTSVESGINYSSCTPSDSSGMTVCKVRSHRDGMKSLSIPSTTQALQVEFEPAKDSNAMLFDAVSGGHAKLAAGTDTVTGTAGKAYNVPRQEIPSIMGAIRTDVSIRQ